MHHSRIEVHVGQENIELIELLNLDRRMAGQSRGAASPFGGEETNDPAFARAFPEVVAFFRAALQCPPQTAMQRRKQVLVKTRPQGRENGFRIGAVDSRR